jgi:hypothetical protein
MVIAACTSKPSRLASPLLAERYLKMEWIFVLLFCGLVALGAKVIGKINNSAALLWIAVWGAAFAVEFWPF